MGCSHRFDGLGQYFVFFPSSLMNDLHPCLSVTLFEQPHTHSLHDNKTVSSQLKDFFSDEGCQSFLALVK